MTKPTSILQDSEIAPFHAKLVSLQAIYPLKKPLRTHPNYNFDGEVEDIRNRIKKAIDPIGVQLMRHLNESYEAFTQIGQTDMALVYKSRDRNLERPVAIKTLIHTEKLDHFRQRARDAAVIADEPNYVTLYELGMTEQRPYCVMQYIEGHNLRTWIESDNRRPLAVVIRILSKVTRALIAAHALGASYGNLKPSNIVLAKNNEPFILPMGRSVSECRGPKVLDELERRSLNCEEIKEIAYLAPEQFDEIETLSGELTDQYMLGLLAFELITGTLPPTIGDKAPTLTSLAEIRRKGSAAFCDLPRVSDLRPDCSEVMANIIQRMSKRRPHERYPSLKELLVDMRRQEDVVLARVRDSYRRCMNERSPTRMSFIGAAYSAFFERRKDAEALFKNLGRRQYEILERAIVDLFSFYEQERGLEPNEPNALTQVAQKHDRNHLKIALDFYPQFIDSLIDIACGSLSSTAFSFDPKCRNDDVGQARIRSAWQDVLRPGVDYMKSKY